MVVPRPASCGPAGRRAPRRVLLALLLAGGLLWCATASVAHAQAGGPTPPPDCTQDPSDPACPQLPDCTQDPSNPACPQLPDCTQDPDNPACPPIPYCVQNPWDCEPPPPDLGELAPGGLQPPGYVERRPSGGERSRGTTGCSSSGTGAARVSNSVDPRGLNKGSPNPLAGLKFYIPLDEPSVHDVVRYWQAHQVKPATYMLKLAAQPKFRWFGRWTGRDMPAKVRDFIDCAQASGTVPLMVVLRAQAKACNPRYAAGGAAEDRRTRSWYDRFAAAVGHDRVVIGFEPDSIGTVDCLARSRRRARLRTLRYGVKVLSGLPNATIYLEAGASDWEPPAKVAKKLRYIGIRSVRGFMVNVTHYDWTANNIRYGRRVSRLVGGKPFIVSTSFNGRGPVHVAGSANGHHRGLNVWCHPKMRGSGPPPRTDPAPKVDALMWIGRPGYSAGGCNGGPSTVGAWWQARALMFGKYATNWWRPPKGTFDGLRHRYSPRQLGDCGARCT